MADTPKRALPPLPHLDRLRKEAKARLAEMRARMPMARLADAQHLLAREYGFANWAALKVEVERRAGSADAIDIRQSKARGALHRAQTLRALSPEENDPQSPAPFLRAGVTMIVGFSLVALLGLATVIVGSEGGADKLLSLLRAFVERGP